MAHLDTDEQAQMRAVRHLVRSVGMVQRAQAMLLAATIAAFGIVAVAAAMMTTLL